MIIKIGKTLLTIIKIWTFIVIMMIINILYVSLIIKIGTTSIMIKMNRITIVITTMVTLIVPFITTTTYLSFWSGGKWRNSQGELDTGSTFMNPL